MNDEKQSELTARLSVVWTQIIRGTGGNCAIDLKRMYGNAVNLSNECNKEWVECRRLRKITSKYLSLQKDLELALTNLEHYVTLASLMS